MRIAAASDQFVLRAVKSYRAAVGDKGYSGSYDLRDERTDAVLACCDIFGPLLFSKTVIRDTTGQPWHLSPNRRIMPTRWILADLEGKIAMQFDQSVRDQIFKPLTRKALFLLDADGRECFHLVDSRDSAFDRAIGNGPSEWHLMEKNELKARIGLRQRQPSVSKGVRAKIWAFFSPSDWTIDSCGSTHILPAPVALSLILAIVKLDTCMKK